MGTQNILYQKEDNTIFIGLNITVIFKSKQNKTSHEQIYAVQYVSKLQRLNSNVYKFYNNKIKYIFRVGVMYSGEYDVNFVMLRRVFFHTGQA